MSTTKSPTVAQKKKRLMQLRDAQRRRRERLRNDKQHFVQVILPEWALERLSQLSQASSETMQQLIARIVLSALPGQDVEGNIDDEAHVESGSEENPGMPGSDEVGTDSSEETVDPVTGQKRRSQLDLFG